jgi:hypothetical protein
MVPPLDISLEIRQKFFGAHELVIRLLLVPVPVVSLPTFVVIPEDANLVDYICQTVFKQMLRSGQRPRKTPKDKICKPVLCENDPVSEQLDGLHVGDYDNTYQMLSMAPTAR